MDPHKFMREDDQDPNANSPVLWTWENPIPIFLGKLAEDQALIRKRDSYNAYGMQ